MNQENPSRSIPGQEVQVNQDNLQQPIVLFQDQVRVSVTNMGQKSTILHHLRTLG